MDAPEINLDSLSPDQLSALESDLKEQLRIYFRHIVGLAIAYEHVAADGTQKPQKPLCYSAAVCQIDQEWFLLTAGHILQEIETIVRHPKMRLVACGLDDTYAPGSADKSPIQYFDYESAPRFHRYKEDDIAGSSEGLDFGLIHLRQNYRDLLRANGIQPITEQHWNESHVQQCTTFLMVGFPQDSIDTDIVVSRTHYKARVKGSPSVILIDRLQSAPAQIAHTDYPRFFGQIRDKHNVGSIVGMSGGPIFGFKGSDFEPYSVAAIQSKWIEERKLTFGCSIPVILDVARDFIESI